MRDYVRVPPAPQSPVSTPVFPNHTPSQQTSVHTSSSRNYAPIEDRMPEASTFMEGASRLSQRAAATVGIQIGAEVAVHDIEEHLDYRHSHSSLGAPTAYKRGGNAPGTAYQRATTGDSNNAQFLRHEKSKSEWFDTIVERSRPQRRSDVATESGGMPARSGYQPDVRSMAPQMRPKMWRGADAIDTQTALPEGAAGVTARSQGPVIATHSPVRPKELMPGPQQLSSGASRSQQRSRIPQQAPGTIPGVDWSKY